MVDLKTLGRNSLVAGLSEIWRIASRFVLTPVIIAAIGLEGYGTWTLVFSVAAYVSMANASMGLAYTKLTAECVHAQTYDRLERVLGSGMTGIGSVAALGLLATLLFGPSVLRGLGVPADQLGEANTALLLVMGTLVMRMTIGCAHEVLAGLQRIDLTYRLQILASIVDFAVTLPLLLAGWGLVGLGIGHISGQIVANLGAWRAMRRHLPQVRLNPLRMSRDGFRIVFGIGGKFQLLSLVNTVVMHGAKFLIAALIGVRWVGVYELADKLLSLGKAASSAVVAPLMPAFANLQASGDRKAERALFFAASKADALIGGSSFLFLALFAGPMLLAWTGETVPAAAWTLQLIVAGESLFILTSIVSSNLRAQGKVGMEFTAAMVTTVLFVLLLLPLAPWLQFEGFVYARVAAQAVGALWFLRAYFTSERIGARDYFRETRIPYLAAIWATLAAGTLAARHLVPWVPPHASPRWAAVFTVFAWGVPFGAILLTAAWRIFLTAAERDKLVSTVRDIIARRRARRAAAPPA
jgi:O-antigen/teichoic acid export membrane protein